MATTARSRAYEVVRVKLGLLAHRTAVEIVDALDRDDLLGEIDRLQDEITRLEKKLEAAVEREVALHDAVAARRRRS